MTLGQGKLTLRSQDTKEPPQNNLSNLTGGFRYAGAPLSACGGFLRSRPTTERQRGSASSLGRYKKEADRASAGAKQKRSFQKCRFLERYRKATTFAKFFSHTSGQVCSKNLASVRLKIHSAKLLNLFLYGSLRF